MLTKKVIWTMWYQGYDQAPELVKTCINSWKHFNPNYELIVLDKRSLAKYTDLENVIDLQRKDLNFVKISNLVRVNVLHQYGGVWADATLFCCKPLDEWLFEYFTQGFFCFRNTNPDRLFSNWFLVAQPDNVIIKNIFTILMSFYKENYFSNQNNFFEKVSISILSKILNKNIKTTVFWDSFFIKKIIRAYPYFIFHYLFNKLILVNPICAEVWNNSKSFSNLEPTMINKLYKTNDIRTALMHIAKKSSPVYKLNWKVNAKEPYWEQVLNQLNLLQSAG